MFAELHATTVRDGVSFANAGEVSPGYSAPWAGPGVRAADFTKAAFARAIGADVVLVVGLRLGCLSHARLSARAIAADGCRLAGWIGNTIEPGFDRCDDYLGLLREALPAPCRGVLPHLPSPGAAAGGATAAARIDVSSLLS